MQNIIRFELWHYVTFHNLQLLLNDVLRASQNEIKTLMTIGNVVFQSVEIKADFEWQM